MNLRISCLSLLSFSLCGCLPANGSSAPRQPSIPPAVPNERAKPGPIACGAKLEITPQNRASIVAEFAGERSLGVPYLETERQRQEWVEDCLSSRGSDERPAGCDLRSLVPFDPSWWQRLPASNVVERSPPILQRKFNEGAAPCRRVRLVWKLRERLVVSEEEQRKGVGNGRMLQVDASTGDIHEVSTWSSQSCGF